VTGLPPRRRPTAQETLAKAEAAARRRRWEDQLELHIKAWGLPIPEREFHFDAVRMWRFDFAFAQFRVAVEIEGITWAGGRHQRPAGFEADAIKYARAAELGWLVLRVTPAMVKSGHAIRLIETVLFQQKAGW